MKTRLTRETEPKERAVKIKVMIVIYALMMVWLIVFMSLNHGIKIEGCKIKLGRLEDIEVSELSIHEITENEINDYINSLLKEYAQETEKTGEAEIGDIVELEVGSIITEGGIAEEYISLGDNVISLEIGSNDNKYPGLDTLIEGHSSGETLSIYEHTDDNGDISYSFEGDDEEQISLYITAVYEKIIPTVTDEFIQANLYEEYGISTADELREYAKESLSQSIETGAESALYDNVLSALMETSEFIYISDDFKTECADLITMSYEAIWRAKGYESYNDYVDENNITTSTLNTEAEELIFTRLIEEALAKKYGLELSESEKEKYLEELLAEYNLSTENELKQYFTENELEYLLLKQKVYEFVVAFEKYKRA